MTALPRLCVSDNHRFIVTENGDPFFWLGDTAWELFHRLNLEEAVQYLENRQEKQFTVIQAVALAEFDGLNSPNEYGHRPLIDNDPLKPNEPYWEFVDEVIHIAEKCGLYIGFLPTWGDKVTDLWGTGPRIFNVSNAFEYGEWLGRRYQSQNNIIWVIGGDRPVVYQGKNTGNIVDDTEIWRLMAEGIQRGVGRSVLMTYHPSGGHSSSEYIHTETWLDVNMMQSGHGSGHDVPVWKMIANDYNRIPPKPTLDGEPNYEDHPVNPWPVWDPESGYFDDYDVRKQIYRSVFSGACGVTYGHHSVWQMYSQRYEVINHAKMYWSEALDRPGASQVKILRALIESRRFLKNIPDQSLFKDLPDNNQEYPCALRDTNQSFAYMYLPTSKPITINLDRLNGGQINAYWYVPATGATIFDGKYTGGICQSFYPPGGSLDWVLILENVNINEN